MIFLKTIARLQFMNLQGDSSFKDQICAAWVNTTCRDIQTAVIKTCAYNNRSVLKRAFSKDYIKMYPGTIFILFLPIMNIFLRRARKVEVTYLPPPMLLEF